MAHEFCNKPMLNPAPYSSEFCDLVKRIGEARSKQEEDRIATAERTLLQSTIATQCSPDVLKERVVRALYCHMLGQECSFAFIHMITLCSHNSGSLAKRTGYLACCLCLDRDSELVLLLVNFIQKDLKGSNLLDTVSALTCVECLVSSEIAPALVADVENLVKHMNATVRRKALLALWAIFKVAPECVTDFFGCLERSVCDSELSVLAASVAIVKGMLLGGDAATRRRLEPLVPVFVGMQQQILHHRFPRDYDFHHMPAPWLQMSILDVLAALGKGSRNVSQEIYEVLGDTLRRAESGTSNVSYALAFQATLAICTVYPSTKLISLAASTISPFLASPNNNLKHAGILALEMIAKVDPEIVSKHQLAVVECLEDTDLTLRRKTLDLLVAITTVDNVEVVVDQLLGQLKVAVDDYWRRDLVAKVSRVVERYAVSPIMFVDTLLQTMHLAGDLADFTNLLLSFVCEGPGGDLEAEFHERVVEIALGYTCTSERLNDCLAETCLWILAEYGWRSSFRAEALEAVREMAASTSTRVMAALVELVAKWTDPQAVEALAESDTVVALFDRCLTCDDVLLRQKAAETRAFVLLPPTTRLAFRPFDGFCDEIDVEVPVFNAFVESSLRSGARPYRPLAVEDPVTPSENANGIRFEPYEKQPAHNVPLAVLRSQGRGASHPVEPAPLPPPMRASASIQTKSHVWGPGGLQKPPAPENLPPCLPSRAPATVAPAMAAVTETRLADKQRTADKLFRRKAVNEPPLPAPVAEAADVAGAGEAVDLL